jgi:holo-[acyl-carrier protein] synthase
MVLSTGIDVIEVERIHKAMERWGERFLRRIFTAGEIRYCRQKRRPEISFAVRFAAKEAAMKALGRGPREGVRWKGLEVVNLESGAPTLQPGRSVRDLIGDKRVLISLSHTRELAVAVALLVDDRGEK